MHAQGFVLLKENRFDSAAFLRTLQQEWGITPDDDGMPLSGEMLTFNIAGNLCAVSLMPAPIPDGEAEASAAYNYYWPEAVEAARQHQAHLLVAVMPTGDGTPLDRMRLYSKIVSSCLADANATKCVTDNCLCPSGFFSASMRTKAATMPTPSAWRNSTKWRWKSAPASTT